MKVKIIMDTVNDAREVQAITREISSRENFNDRICIVDAEGLRVNANSFVGLLHAMEFNELWLEANGDYYREYNKFIVGSNLEPPAAY